MRVTRAIRIAAALALWLALALAAPFGGTGTARAEDCPCQVQCDWCYYGPYRYECCYHGCDVPGCVWFPCGPGEYPGNDGKCYPIGSPGPSAPPGGGGACWIDVADNLRVNWSYSPSKMRFS